MSKKSNTAAPDSAPAKAADQASEENGSTKTTGKGQKGKQNASTGGHPSRKQKQQLMEGGRVSKRGPNPTQQKLGLNSWESIPYTIGQFELQTPYSQHVMSRFKRNLAVNAYLAEVFPSAHGWKRWIEILQCIETLVDRAHEKVDATFKEVEGQVDHMFEVIGLEDEDVPQYINSRTFTYAVTTPRVRQILNYLPRMDRIVKRMEALWMAESGISSTYIRQEAMRLRTAVTKYAGALFRQSDRVRRVMGGRATAAELLTDLQDELSEHYGSGLKEKDKQGNDMLLPGEPDIEGPLVGEEENTEVPAGAKDVARA